MADTIIDNINSIIRTKSELKSVLTENGQNPSDTFSEYPDMFRSAIQAASENGANEEIVNAYISAYLSAYSFIDQDMLSANSYLTQHQDLSSYASKSYVADYVATYAPVPDLSSYVTYSYAYETYPTYSYADMKYFGSLAATINDGNVISSIGESFDTGASVRGLYYQKTYVPSYAYIESYYTSKSELSNAGYLTSVPNTYPTYAAIENMAYITMADVSACGYITASDIPSVVVPVVNENLIPKETATYTLGDSTHYYAATYTNSVNLTKNTFTNRLYTSGQYSIACEINGGVRYSFMAGSIRPDVSNADLGTSSAKWQNTYTANLWADNIHNFIWTGTSAEYALLDNYTSYQIYLIQEA